MNSQARQAGRPGLWVVWCAALLIVAGALATLHAATPHPGTQRHCAVCVALHAPSAGPEKAGLHRPLPPSAPLVPAPIETAHSHDGFGLECGRAPPRAH